MFTISFVGRTKVGKTSLFKTLLEKNNYLWKNNIFDFNYLIKYFKDKYFIIIDNIYLNRSLLKSNKKSNLYLKLYNKFIFNIINSDLVCLLIDLSSSLLDEDIYFYKNIIKKYTNNIILILNKLDLLNNLDKKYYIYKYYSLGIKNIISISIFNKKSILNLLNSFYDILIKKFNNNITFFKYLLKFCINFEDYYEIKKLYFNNNIKYINNVNLNININNIKIIILGKTNVGKSTLLNSICDNNCSFVSKYRNTTKSFIFYNFFINNINFLISDSPGISKKYFDKYYTLSKFLKKIVFFKVVFFLVDINDGLTDYDLSCIKLLLSKGKILFIIFNKCEKLNSIFKYKYYKYIKRKYGFLKNIFIYFICAINLNKKFIFNLLKLVNIKYNNIFLNKISTSKINKILKLAINNFNENNNFQNLINFKYAHIGNYNPFTIIIHCKKINNINISYKKYLINFFTRYLNFYSYNINIKFKKYNNLFKYKK